MDNFRNWNCCFYYLNLVRLLIMICKIRFRLKIVKKIIIYY